MALWDLLSRVVPMVVAVVGWRAYLMTRRRWRHDLAQHAEEQARWVRRPAELVWITVEEQDWPREKEGTYRARVATVRNDSDGPARDLSVWWFLDGKALGLPDRPQRAALAPGQAWSIPEPTWLTHMGDHHQVTASLWFADFRDQHWETSHRGQVRLLREAVAEGYDFVC